MVVLGGIADPGAGLDGGIGAVGVGDVVVGEAVVGAVVDGAPVDALPVVLLVDGIDDDPLAPLMPGLPDDPALPIVGFERTNEGVAADAPPAELAGEVTHPVTVTICAPPAPPPGVPAVVWVCAAAPAVIEAASAVAKAICLFMIVLS